MLVGVDEVLELVGVVSGGGDVEEEGPGFGTEGVDSYPLAGGGLLEELQGISVEVGSGSGVVVL